MIIFYQVYFFRPIVYGAYLVRIPCVLYSAISKVDTRSNLSVRGTIPNNLSPNIPRHKTRRNRYKIIHMNVCIYSHLILSISFFSTTLNIHSNNIVISLELAYVSHHWPRTGFPLKHGPISSETYATHTWFIDRYIEGYRLIPDEIFYQFRSIRDRNAGVMKKFRWFSEWFFGDFHI